MFSNTRSRPPKRETLLEVACYVQSPQPRMFKSEEEWHGEAWRALTHHSIVNCPCLSKYFHYFIPVNWRFDSGNYLLHVQFDQDVLGPQEKVQCRGILQDIPLCDNLRALGSIARWHHRESGLPLPKCDDWILESISRRAHFEQIISIGNWRMTRSCGSELDLRAAKISSLRRGAFRQVLWPTVCLVSAICVRKGGLGLCTVTVPPHTRLDWAKWRRVRWLRWRRIAGGHARYG